MRGGTEAMTSTEKTGTRMGHAGDWDRSGGEFSFSESSTAATKTPIINSPTKDINRFQPTGVGRGRINCIMEASKRLRGVTEAMTSENSRETMRMNLYLPYFIEE
jgi:hypothetical protein